MIGRLGREIERGLGKGEKKKSRAFCFSSSYSLLLLIGLNSGAISFFFFCICFCLMGFFCFFAWVDFGDGAIPGPWAREAMIFGLYLFIYLFF